MRGSATGLLRWQFRQAHELLEASVGRRPIGTAAGEAAWYARAVLCEDIGVNGVLAAGIPLALSTWAGRTGLDPLPWLGPPIDWWAWARAVRLDPVAIRTYASAVYEATDVYLAGLADPPDATTVRVLTALLLTVSMVRGEVVGQSRRVPTSPPVSTSGVPRATEREQRRRTCGT